MNTNGELVAALNGTEISKVKGAIACAFSALAG